MHEFKINVGGLVVEVTQDDDFTLDYLERLGTIITTNNPYWVGDEVFGLNTDYEDSEEWQEKRKKIVEEGGVYIPLYAYIHSGVTLWTEGEASRNACRFDSGCIGGVYATIEDIKKRFKYGDDCTIETYRTLATDLIKNEIKTLDEILNSNVLRWDLYECDPNAINFKSWVDGCGGYYGDDKFVAESILAEVRPYLSQEQQERLKKAFEEIL